MERACLGSIIVKGNAMFILVNSVLKPHHFYQEKHQLIFSEMLKLYKRNIQIDTVTLSDSLKESGLKEKCDGAYYITGLVEVTPTPSQGKYYAEQVLRDYNTREKILLGQRLANGEEIDVEELKKLFNTQLNKSLLITDQPMDFWDIVKDKTPKPSDFIEGYLPIESIAMDVGIQGIGKTLFNLNKAICLSNGGSWFGLKILKAVKVLYFIAEGGYFSIQNRIKTMAEYTDSQPKVDFLTIAPITPFKITESSNFQMIELIIDKILPDVIFFDPLVKIHNSDENSNNEMEVVMNKLRSLITGKNRSIVIVHHVNKSQQSRGASAIEGDVDSSLQISWANKTKGIR
ncbi:AAA family ATPase, partial [Candidatus Neomarinimicrobiota bacterium]